MALGGMQKIVRFDKNIPVPKGAGWSDVYTTLLTTIGELKRNSSSRNLITGEIMQPAYYELNTMWQQALEDNLRSDTKIVIDGKVFTIQGEPEKIQEKNFKYRFTIAETGGYATDGIAGGSLFVDEPLFLSNDGFDFVQSSKLVGNNIKIKLVMIEDGPPLQPILITDLLTDNRQYKHDSNTGKIYFFDLLNNGAIVYILYKS